MKNQKQNVSVIAHYQYMENYGAHNWDGEGECPQRWKAKGGSQKVIVQDISLQEWVCNMSKYKRLASNLGQMNEYYEEILLGVEVVTKSTALVNKVISIINADEYGDRDYLKWEFDNDFAWDWAVEQIAA